MKYELLKPFDVDSIDVGDTIEIKDGLVRIDDSEELGIKNGTIRADVLERLGYIKKVDALPKFKIGDKVVFEDNGIKLYETVYSIQVFITKDMEINGAPMEHYRKPTNDELYRYFK